MLPTSTLGRVKKLFDESFHDNFPQGVQASFDHFLALEDYKVNLIAVVNVTGSLGSTTGKHLFLPGLFFESEKMIEAGLHALGEVIVK